ncbi:MAG: FAD-dependent oxidoreductase [Burkholderiaceae bacterium]
MNPIIIIGAGLAGWTTAREFRKLDATTPVVMITADSGDFYAKPTLSNAFAQKKAPDQLVVTPAAKMSETQNVILMAHTRVLRVDPYVKTITTEEDGIQQSFDFSSLVLATGAQPIRIPVAGDAAEQVLSVNSLDDFTSFFEVLKSASSRRIDCLYSYENNSKKSNENEASFSAKIVIMGAGLIGCEFANDLVNAGYQVSVIDPASRPLGALLPEAASEQLRLALQDLGVQWHFGTTVLSVNKAVNKATNQPDKEAESALRVTLANGESIPADVVLSAIGLRSDTRLALAAGLACERGIQVDSALQTSAPNVYALGDSAQYASAGNTTLPYVMPIMNAARALAQTLSGNKTEVVFPVMPVAVKTPALPLMIAPPKMGSQGQWASIEPNVWQFSNEQNVAIGFVLAGAQTSKRAEMVKLLQTAL